MRIGYKKLLGAVLLVLILQGCQQGTNRSPQELLTLAVSGLSGTDHYAFRGDTGIGSDRQLIIHTVAFQGMVRDHNHVELKGSGVELSPTPQFHPLKLLFGVENSAVNIELVPGTSNVKQAVLYITADPKKEATNWARQLRDEFALLEKKIPVIAAAERPTKQGRRSHHAAAQTVTQTVKQTAFHEAWYKELSRSRQELEAMLSTLQVQASSKLIIDRKKLLPLSLEQQTTFHYKTTSGVPAQEIRRTRVSFHRPDGQNW